MTVMTDRAAAIRPFRVEVSPADVDDLRRRLAATRWPEKETVSDFSQGVPLATMQKLVKYWSREYDFGRVEARLNALPQFVTEVDGLRHPLHPRQVTARGGTAAAHHARLAGLGRRDAERRRAARRPDRARR